MDRRRFLLASLTAVLAAPRAGEAQQATKVYRVGLLDESNPDRARLDWWEAFQQHMGELGYVDGQNVIFERRWARGKSERMATLAAELVKLRVDIIVTAGAPAVLAAKTATTTIPIVMAIVADPVKLKLVSSLARPGGNITGITSIASELSGKRLSLVKEVVPRVSRVAILWDRDNPGSALAVRDTEAAAESLGIVLQSLGVRTGNGVAAAFSAMTREHAGTVILVQSSSFFPERRRLAELALTHRLPTIAGSKREPEAGGLMSYGTHYPDLFRRAAIFVDKILKGANPADLPIEQPTTFELVINMKTAKALSLTIPQSLLQRADQVISEPSTLDQREPPHRSGTSASGRWPGGARGGLLPFSLRVWEAPAPREDHSPTGTIA